MARDKKRDAKPKQAARSQRASKPKQPKVVQFTAITSNPDNFEAVSKHFQTISKTTGELPAGIINYALNAEELEGARLFTASMIPDAEFGNEFQNVRQTLFETAKASFIDDKHDRFGIEDFDAQLDPTTLSQALTPDVVLTPSAGFRHLGVSGPQTIANLQSQSRLVAAMFNEAPQTPVQEFYKSINMYADSQANFANLDFSSIQTIEDFKNLKLDNGMTLETAVIQKQQGLKSKKAATPEQVLNSCFKKFQEAKAIAQNYNEIHTYGQLDPEEDSNTFAGYLRAAQNPKVSADALFVEAMLGNVNLYDMKSTAEIVQRIQSHPAYDQFNEETALGFKPLRERLVSQYGESDIAAIEKKAGAFSSATVPISLAKLIERGEVGFHDSLTGSRRNGNPVKGGQKDLPEWTLGNLKQAWRDFGQGAQGYPQITRDTFLWLQENYGKQLGLDSDDIQFNRPGQDRTFLGLITYKRPAVCEAIRTGTSADIESACYELCLEQACVENPKDPGYSYYKNVSGNKPTIKVDEVRTCLKNTHKIYARLKEAGYDDEKALELAVFHYEIGPLSKAQDVGKIIRGKDGKLSRFVPEPQRSIDVAQESDVLDPFGDLPEEYVDLEMYASDQLQSIQATQPTLPKLEETKKSEHISIPAVVSALIPEITERAKKSVLPKTAQVRKSSRRQRR